MKKTIALAVLCTLLAPITARAGSPGPFADKFFASLKKVFSDADAIELARYAVWEPEHANSVYGHVSSEDYVYIGILVTAKATRNQKIPKLGTFDYNFCMTPINMFNAVFGKSSEFIEKYGQEEHVKAYAQAENEEAKQEASEKLGEYIPYWNEIPHICHFTFFTDLKSEKKIKEQVKSDVQVIKRTYKDFADGDVVAGVDDLISLGVNQKLACSMADDILASGFLTKVPGLGQLAQEACAGFTGAVIGIASDASAAVITGVSNMGDALAGQTKHIPQDQYYQLYWAPRVAEGVAHSRAGSWTPFIKSVWNPCVSYFDKHTMSEANARKTCDYHRDALFTPAVQKLQTTQDNQADIAQKLPVWAKGFVDKWHPQCSDGACGDTILALTKTAMSEGEQLKKSHGADGWIYVATALESYTKPAAAEIEASKTRFAGTNKKITDQASLGWADLYVGAWLPKCADDACRKEVQTLGKNMVVGAKLLQTAKKDESSLKIQGQIGQEYGVKFQKAIDDSKHRMIAADPKAKPDDRLPYLACKHFLGRQGEWLCEGDLGFDACVGYVKAGSATNCLNSSDRGHYATIEYATKSLRNAGCKNDGASREFECASQAGLEACGQFKTGGIQFICNGAKAQKEAHGNPPPASTPKGRTPRIVRTSSAAPVVDAKTALDQQGCRHFLGRADDYLCPKGPAFDACEVFKKKGEVKACRASK